MQKNSKTQNPPPYLLCCLLEKARHIQSPEHNATKVTEFTNRDDAADKHHHVIIAMQTTTTTLAAREGQRGFFENHTVEEIITNKKNQVLVDAPVDMTLDQVLHTLCTNNIRAVPVYQMDKGEKVYQGFVSTFDIVFYIALEVYCREEAKTASQEEREELFREYNFKSTTLGDVVGSLSQESGTVWTFQQTDTVETACDYFSKGVHQALIESLDEAGRKRYRMITQTDLVRFFLSHVDELKTLKVGQNKAARTCPKSLGEASLEELGLCNAVSGGRIVSISEKNIAVEGLHRMQIEGVQGMPVLDGSGKLIATFSTADIRGLDTGNFDRALLPVIEYLKATYGGKLLHPLTCKAQDKLPEVITNMLAADVHRHQIWITDEQERVVGVVSMTDVISNVYDCLLSSSYIK